MNDGQKTDAFITTLVARIMAVIVSHRYTIHAGEEHPRLNRDQRITAVLPPQPSEKLQNIIDWVTYGISDNYYRRLGKLYVDEIVYLDQWKTFAAHCAKDWKVAITWSGPSLICSVLMSMTPAALPASGSLIVSGFSSGFPGAQGIVSGSGIRVKKCYLSVLFCVFRRAVPPECVQRHPDSKSKAISTSASHL